MSKYDHKAIEKKWQQLWEKSGAFRAEENSKEDNKKEKVYILDMFPYPSGAGLHVGHVEGYTATDIYSRFKRMQGYNVLHPMGWDAFGLPAENYAIKTGIAPKKTTEDSINTFRAQIKSLGLSYDWSREIGTHTPEYYKWTQWLFTKFFEEGLVYKKKALVNWDPVDQTVLANEQVLPDGTAERSGAKVVQKDLEQWFFKITDFADALVDNLDQVDWPESTKINQRNWIGRSEGAQIDFEIPRSDLGKIKVFTTRPDTLFGATYLVLAPEHPFAESLGEKSSNKKEVFGYIKAAKNKTNLERQEGEKEKTGVELKGVKAINPGSKKEIPIYVADYVLGSYGTGAIMAVPAHDERDYAFAKKFNLPVKRVIEPKFVATADETKLKPSLEIVKRNAICAIIRNPKNNTYLCMSWKGVSMHGLVTRGIDGDEDIVEAAKREVLEETGYKNLRLVEEPSWIINTFFYHRVKKENRHARFHYVFLELENDEREPIAEKEAALHEVTWKKKDELKDFFSVFEGNFIVTLLNNPDYVHTGEGILGNSGQFDGLESEEAKKKIVEAVEGKWVKTYRLRDWLISRQRYWGAPIPIVYDPTGKAHAIPTEHLPWMLPTDVEFKPKGTSPLGQSKELLARTEKIFGKGWKPEIDTMDTFVCSSWYYYRFADPHNDKEFASREAMQKWLPVDLYMGGAEHTVLHLMYARFFTKALQKFGLVDFNEPFLKLRHQGTILAEDGSKMSKSKNNIISPDHVVERYGADTLRLYEMFMGPLEAMKPWNTQNILGVRRFLERVWRMSEGIEEIPAGEKTIVAMNQAIAKVSTDIETLKMNTAVSELMIFLNHLETLPVVPKKVFGIFLKLLAPLAPHMAHELWEKLNTGAPLNQQKWPIPDQSKLIAIVVRVAVQINGKVRTTLEVPTDMEENEALAMARKEPIVSKWLNQGKETKALYVPGKIISFVVKAV
jgi:leucyl-tRNA synthetase